MPTLAATVIVRHPDTGATVALLRGDDLPGWAEGLVAAERLVSPAPGAEAVVESADPDDDGLGDLEVETAVDDPSAGTIDDVLDRVGDDKALAKAALEAEGSKGAKARTTLLAELRAILGRD